MVLQSFALLFPLSSRWDSLLHGLDVTALKFLNGNRVVDLDLLLQTVTVTAYGLGMLVPVCLYGLGYLNREVWFKLKAFQFLFAMCLNVLLTGTLKYTVDRPRPFVTDRAVVQRTEAGSPSFPSGHTAFAFTTAAALGRMFAKVWLRMFVLAWALLVAYSRLALGVHYPSDVLASVLIGAASASLAGYAFREHRGKVLALLKAARRLNGKGSALP